MEALWIEKCAQYRHKMMLIVIIRWWIQGVTLPSAVNPSSTHASILYTRQLKSLLSLPRHSLPHHVGLGESGHIYHRDHLYITTRPRNHSSEKDRVSPDKEDHLSTMTASVIQSEVFLCRVGWQ